MFIGFRINPKKENIDHKWSTKKNVSLAVLIDWCESILASQITSETSPQIGFKNMIIRRSHWKKFDPGFEIGDTNWIKIFKLLTQSDWKMWRL